MIRYLVVGIFVLMVIVLSDCSKKKVNIEVIPDAPIENLMPDPVVKEEPRIEPDPPVFQEKRFTIYFDFDSYEIREEYKNLIDEISIYSDRHLEIYGGCCPIGTDDYNFALGLNRASAVKKYIGFESARCVSWGESNLVTEDEDNYKKNRRCEIIVR